MSSICILPLPMSVIERMFDTMTPPADPHRSPTADSALPDAHAADLAGARHAIERIRRSVAMLPPGQKALSREDAMAVLSRLDRAEGQIDHLRQALNDVLGEQ